MRIDRCICTGKSFEQLLKHAREHGEDLQALGRSCGAGARCGLCRPYLRQTLQTGQTVFHHVVIDESCDRPAERNDVERAKAG